jgi:hypothetical protein
VDLITEVGVPCPWKYVRLFCKDANIDTISKDKTLTPKELLYIQQCQMNGKYSHSKTRSISVRFDVSLSGLHQCKITYRCFNAACAAAEGASKYSKEIKSYPILLSDVINSKLRSLFFCDYLNSNINATATTTLIK